MRTISVIALAALIAPALTGQVASYVEAIALTAAAPSAETAFLMDAAESVQVVISSTSQTLEVALIDPDGAVHPMEGTDGVVAASTTNDVAEGNVQGRSYAFALRNPRPGVWKYRVRETGSLTKSIAVLFSVTSSSDLAARLLGTSDDFNDTGAISLGLVLADSNGPVGPGVIQSIKGYIQTAGKAPIEIQFTDDGTGGDPTANDGVYASTFTAPGPGNYFVSVTILGVYRDRAFSRSVSGTFRAVEPCALLTSNFSSKAVDTSGGGTPDALDVEFGVTTVKDGLYRVSAVLSSAKKQQTAAEAEVNLASGAQTARVRFDLARLADLGDNGPYSLDEVRVGCVIDGSVQTSDRRNDLGPTASVDVSAATAAKAPRSGGIGLTGANTEQTGTLIFQLLDFGLGIEVPSAGTYQWNGALYDSKGTQIDWVSGSGNLPAGKATAMFSFSGSKIGRNGVDGPFILRNVVVEGPANSGFFLEAGRTQPYPYYKFADSPARKAIEVSPASLNFGSVGVGQTKDLTLTILSAGNATLSVSAISSDNPRFAVTAGGAPFSLAAGVQRSVTVRFQPSSQDTQTARLTIVSDDASNSSMVLVLTGTGTAPAAAGIEITPASLDFGSVGVGQTKDLTLTVRNISQSTLSVSSVASSNGRFTLVSPGTPFNIGAGSLQTVSIRFSPTAAGAQSGTLTINSSDAGRPSVIVPVIGTAAAATQSPVIELGATSLDFGSVQTGQTKDLALRIRNTGSAVLIVLAVTISNSSFAMTQPGTPFNVGQGSFQDINLRFSPSAAGTFTGTLTIGSNDPVKPVVTVPVQGTAAGGPGAGSGNRTQIVPVSVAGWPNGRTTDNLPPNAIDGNTNTFTWTTNSFNTTAPCYLGLDFGSAKTVNQIRLYKDADGGGGQNMKNLVIEYTTTSASTQLASRTWTAVTGLANGFNGTELLTASSVSANGTVTGDTHNSPVSGWATLTFNGVNATGVRVGFSNPGGTSFFNHYRVYEFQAYTTTTGTGGSNPRQINPGQSVSGTLTAASGHSVDCSDCFADTYVMTLTEPRRLTITLTSTAFDVYLNILDTSGRILAADDDSGGGTNAKLVGDFTAGTFVFEVTAAVSRSTGSYTLTVSQ